MVLDPQMIAVMKKRATLTSGAGDLTGLERLELCCSSDSSDSRVQRLAQFLGERKMALHLLDGGGMLLLTAIVAREGRHVFECRLRPGSAHY